MAALRVGRAVPRGAAALEFALLVPWMLLLFSGLYGFGMVVWTQMVVSSTLQSSVRYCVAAQQSMSGDATTALQSCTAAQFAATFAPMAQLCDAGAPTVTSQTQYLVVDQLTSRPTFLLNATVTCGRNYLPFSIFNSMTLTSATLRAHSALPFTP